MLEKSKLILLMNLIILRCTHIFLVDADEMHVLKATWQDLADRNNGKGIDKETFLQYFPLNGLLGGKIHYLRCVINAGFIIVLCRSVVCAI